MHSTMMIKQIMDFNKKAFDDSFNTVVAVQEHAEKMVHDFWEKSTFFPEERKRAFGDWVSTYKSGLDEFKANADSRFKLVEDYLLNAADQMESSLKAVVKQTEPVTPADAQMTKKVAADIKKAAARKPAVKKEKIGRKKQ
jgi:hypothetical protein